MSLKYSGTYNYVLLDTGERLLPGDEELVGRDKDGNNEWEPFQSNVQTRVYRCDVMRRRIDKDVARKITESK